MNDETPVALRLKATREAAGVGLREMARRVGKSPSSYGHYEDPERFKSRFLPLDLAQSFGSALRREGREEEILALAGVGNEASILGPVQVVGSNGQHPPAMRDRKTVSGATGDEHLLAIYDVSSKMDLGQLAPDYEAVSTMLDFPANYLKSITSTSVDQLCIVSVSGDSMAPTLGAKDIVMVDMTKQNPDYDGIFALRHNGLLKVKRLVADRRSKTFTLLSDNPTHRDMEVPGEDVTVIGRVIWSGVKHP